MISIQQTEDVRRKLEENLNLAISSIKDLPIGSAGQFPYGWRKAAKGRTVWRIVEEAITQNLEYRSEELGFKSLKPAPSEVGVYDFSGEFESVPWTFYVNIKSAVIGGRSNKDDISKAEKLIDFYKSNQDRQLFIASFFISFNEYSSGLSIRIEKAIVTPISWIPDIYVNPSNNANLQSSKYKDPTQYVKRTSYDFIQLLSNEMAVANQKRRKKQEK